MNTLCLKHGCEMPIFRVIDGYKVVRCEQCVEEARRAVEHAVESGRQGAYHRAPLFVGLK